MAEVRTRGTLWAVEGLCGGSTGGFGVARPAVVLDVTLDAGWRIHCRRDKTVPRRQVSGSGNWGWERSKDRGSL